MYRKYSLIKKIFRVSFSYYLVGGILKVTDETIFSLFQLYILCWRELYKENKGKMFEKCLILKNI